MSAIAVIVLAGCSAGPVDVDDPDPPDTAVAAACEQLLDKLPATVLEQEQRDIKPSDALAAAWGDPAIVLRCGVDEPAGLEPTSQCLVVNDVGWLASQDGEAADLSSRPEGTVEFTTIGRSAYVELSVPDDDQPQADALVDVAAAIKSTIDDRQPCQ